MNCKAAIIAYACVTAVELIWFGWMWYRDVRYGKKINKNKNANNRTDS